MILKTVMRFALLVVAFAVLASVEASIKPAFAQTCDAETDGKIVELIYGKIEGNKALADQVSHINIVSTAGVVKFRGWADTEKDFDKITKDYVYDAWSSYNCLRFANTVDFLAAPPPSGDALLSSGGCGPGTVQCGDICIPQGETCSITGRMK